MLTIVVELVVAIVRVVLYAAYGVFARLCPFLVPKKDVAGRIVLVTGAGQGIGARMAEKIAALGARLVLWDINEGHVATIASAAGLFGGRKLADYCASKFAAVGFMESLAIEVHGAGISAGTSADPAYKGAANVKTTVVCPYFIATGMFAGAGGRFPWLIRTLEPEEVAQAVVDAILMERDFVLMPPILWFFYWLKPFLPTKALLVLSDFLGLTIFMDKFTGHTGPAGPAGPATNAGPDRKDD